MIQKEMETRVGNSMQKNSTDISLVISSVLGNAGRWIE